MAGDTSQADLARTFSTAAGLATAPRRTIDGDGYRRPIHGTRTPAHVPFDHGTLVEAVRVRLGGSPVLLGISAAWALGCRLAEPDQAVHVMVGSGIRSRELVVAHRGHIDPADVARTSFGAATSPARTAVDLARGFGGTARLGVAARVAWVDALIRATALTASEARDAVAGARELRGLTAASTVVASACDGVDSVKETQLRLLLRRCGFAEPVVQCPVVTSSGTIVAKLDLGWPDHRVGVEYDGAVHREFSQHSRDMARHNRIRLAGWQVVQVDARALREPTEFLAQLRAMLGADHD